MYKMGHAKASNGGRLCGKNDVICSTGNRVLASIPSNGRTVTAISLGLGSLRRFHSGFPM